MFKGYSNLNSLNLSNFKTQNVKSMFGMIAGCRNLLNLDLSSFDTQKVTNVIQMFF